MLCASQLCSTMGSTTHCETPRVMSPAGLCHKAAWAVSAMREAVALIARRVSTEASGNVTLRTAAAIAATGVDYVSCGALTHSVTALDISLRLALEP